MAETIKSEVKIAKPAPVVCLPMVSTSVWYHPCAFDVGGMCVERGEPLAALVVSQHPESNRVSLVVFDAAGFTHRRLYVQFIHHLDPLPPAGQAYAEYSGTPRRSNANE